MTTHARLFRRCTLLFVCLAAAAGCESSPTPAAVAGVVTIDGRPPKAKVLLSFLGADNMSRGVETDDAGHFSFAGLPAGEVRVMVSPANMGGPAAPDPTGGARKGEESGKWSPPPPRRPVKVEIPAAYSDAGNPRLRYTLEPGDNTLTIELKSAIK